MGEGEGVGQGGVGLQFRAETACLDGTKRLGGASRGNASSIEFVSPHWQGLRGGRPAAMGSVGGTGVGLQC